MNRSRDSDALTRAQMHEELLRIQQLKRMTIVFVTHDVEEAVVLADRVVIMAPRPGRIRDTATIALARPRDATRRLPPARPMNSSH